MLVANGETDRMVPTKNTVDLDRRLPNSELVIYPDAGHGGVFQFHEDFAASGTLRRSCPKAFVVARYGTDGLAPPRYPSPRSAT